MLELVTRNRFALPINPMDVGLSWGRRGFSCSVAREIEELVAQEPKRKGPRVAQRPERKPAQVVMSAGLFGPYQPPERPKSHPPLAVVREQHLLNEDFVAVALRGGLIARVNERQMELYPGDEIQVAAGTLCEISVVSSRTRWLFGYRG